MKTFTLSLFTIALACFVLAAPRMGTAQAPGKKDPLQDIELNADAKKYLLEILTRQGDQIKLLSDRVKNQEQEIAQLKSNHASLLANTNSTISTLNGKIDTTAAKLAQVTDGWFMLQSNMGPGNVQHYVLDVRGGRPDNNPLVQLIGQDPPVPQANRLWRFIFVPK